MSMTKTTTITWGSSADQINPNLSTARTAKLVEMQGDGKTNGEFVIISPETSKRFWRDLAAAEEYISFIMEQAEIYNCSIVSTLIEDYPPPL